MISLEEARAMILDAVPGPLGTVSRPLALSVGRILAEPVLATRDHPITDVSAMDGFAVRLEDIEGASPDQEIALRLVGESRAGHEPDNPVWRGEASAISTGARVPVGADTILIREDVRWDDETLYVTSSEPLGRHIRRQGEAFERGDELLPAGHRMLPASVGLAASTGQGSVRVVRRPRVAILGTGDELVSMEQAASRPEAVIDSNGPMLAAALGSVEAEVITVGHLKDDVEPMVEALNALESRADVVLTTGGASVGDHDVVANSWEIAGIATSFWKVAMKPGKPVRFGTRARSRDGSLQYFLALPGNPQAVLACFEQLVLPLLDRLAGGSGLLPPRLRMPLSRDWKKRGPRGHLVRGHLEGAAFEPIQDPGSHTLQSAAQGAAVAWMSPGVEQFSPGQPVTAWVDPEALRGRTLKLLAATPPVVSVTGDSDAGKTTLIERLVRKLTDRGVRVGTVKHANHALSLDTPGKDSHRHRSAGAIRVALVGPGERALFVTDDEAPTMAGWLEPFAGHVDLVLAEGFHDLPMPRIHIKVGSEGSVVTGPVQDRGCPRWEIRRALEHTEQLFADETIELLVAWMMELRETQQV